MSVQERPRLVVWSWFNAKRWTHYADPVWIAQRAVLWQQTALAAMCRQTAREWTYLLLCAEGTEVLVRRAIGETDARVRIVFGDAQALKALPDAESHLVMRCDSDDRLHPRAAEVLLEHKDRGCPWLQFNVGYASKERKIYHWKSRSSPFYARVFRGLKDGADWEKPNHTTLVRRATVLGPGYFCVTLHDLNTSTTRSHAGDRCDPATAARVRDTFGIR